MKPDLKIKYKIYFRGKKNLRNLKCRNCQETFAVYHLKKKKIKNESEFTVIDCNPAVCLQLTMAVSGGGWLTILYLFHCE